jgi:superfamily II DNA or RNA helicase
MLLQYHQRAGVRPRPYELIEAAAASPTGVIITSYEQLRKHADDLLDVNWGYVVLDEGHKIRNPDADITLLCKQVRTAPFSMLEIWALAATNVAWAPCLRAAQAGQHDVVERCRHCSRQC